jgi:hypothetical protein
VEGNETVSELKELIEEKLNDKQNAFHWEKRRTGVVDKSLRYNSEDLPVDTDRFYFLTPNKTILTRDIDHYGANQGKYFKIINGSKDTIRNTNWVFREACKISCR